MIPSVRNLLNKLSDVKSTKISATKCVNEFQCYIDKIAKKHIKSRYTDEYLVPIIYNCKQLKNKSEFFSWAKANLFVANNQLKRFIKEIKRKERVSFQLLKKNKDIFYNFIFELKKPIEILERKKNNDYVFINSEHSRALGSTHIYKGSQLLAWPTIYPTNEIDPDFSMVLSIISLRQALELKFRNIIGVDIYDKFYNRPRFRHTYFYEFIEKNIQYFEFVNVELKLLKQIYSWCNLSVHYAYKPPVWQILFAHSICYKLFDSGYNTEVGGYNIYGAVRIKERDKMVKKFIKTFLEKKEDKQIWCIREYDPEANIHYYKK